MTAIKKTSVILIAALILLSSTATVLRTRTVQATPATGNEIMYATPSTNTITGAAGASMKYNFSIMVANLSNCLTITASIKSLNINIANVSNWYKGADFNSVGFAIYAIVSYDPATGDLDGLTAGSLSPITITTPIELFKVEVTVKNLTAGSVLIDIYDQYAGDIDNDILLQGDCPHDYTINMNAITTNTLVVDSTAYNVTALSNSTISAMSINTSTKTLNFTTSGTDGTTGYFNITIPKTLLNCPAGLTDWIVMKDNVDVTGSAMITQNSTHTFIYIAYSQSTHSFLITGKLVAPESITVHPIVVDSVTYNVTALSNSTISTMTLTKDPVPEGGAWLNFTTSGTDGTTGYFNITIPKNFLNSTALTDWAILFNSTNATSAILSENSTHTFIYLAYSQSSNDIRIHGTHVIPEYPSAAILLTLLAMMAVALALVRKVHKKHWQTL